MVIEVDGERITSVTSGSPAPPSGAVRLDGLTLPGLANAHSHAFQRALRGRTQQGTGSFWTWREQMYRAAERIDPDTYLALARATYAEMALAGVTAVGEFHYLHHGPDGTPYDDPNAMGHALIQAAAEAGIRITLIDACYLHGGIGKRPEGAQVRFADRNAEEWAERASALAEAVAGQGDGSARVGSARFGSGLADSAAPGPAGARIGAAIHSIRAVDPDSARAVASWAREGGRPLHAHVSEQPAENRDCLDAYGRTPTGMLADAGALDGDFTAVHATHMTEADIGLLGGAGACCCICPTTERDLADGIGAMRQLVEAGASLSLGSDSHAVIDMFEEARAVELDERLASGERGRHRAVELLHAAAGGGHACLGWADAGRIEPGARADLVTVGLDSVRLAGTDSETALESVVFAATAADVRHVLVDGNEVVREGRHAAIDVPRELDEAIRAVMG
ncbi:MAG TPA: formimidoylglutamate deiminase [Thermoleophilaceae bacterium]|nr:formimidoylglutamate deiminase [Thermoleophilaceae bacterium]